MQRQRIHCMHRNSVFLGDFELVGEGAEQRVRVHYRGEAMEACPRATLPEVTAHHLLKELVVLDIVKMKMREQSHAMDTG